MGLGGGGETIQAEEGSQQENEREEEGKISVADGSPGSFSILQLLWSPPHLQITVPSLRSHNEVFLVLMNKLLGTEITPLCS